jgi:hypothetical protein
MLERLTEVFCEVDLEVASIAWHRSLTYMAMGRCSLLIGVS